MNPFKTFTDKLSEKLAEAIAQNITKFLSKDTWAGVGLFSVILFPLLGYLLLAGAISINPDYFNKVEQDEAKKIYISSLEENIKKKLANAGVLDGKWNRIRSHDEENPVLLREMKDKIKNHVSVAFGMPFRDFEFKFSIYYLFNSAKLLQVDGDLHDDPKRLFIAIQYLEFVKQAINSDMSLEERQYVSENNFRRDSDWMLLNIYSVLFRILEDTTYSDKAKKILKGDNTPTYIGLGGCEFLAVEKVSNLAVYRATECQWPG